jgi:CBS domain-containing protein
VDVISQRVFSCAPDDDIKEALKIMRKNKVRRLPVIDNEGALEGMLSLTDIAVSAKADGGKPRDASYRSIVRTFGAVSKARESQPEGLPQPKAAVTSA